MIVFISHASEQETAAEEIALALRGEGHEVFLDRSALPEGDAYNARIREAVEACDLIVFLVSPEAVSEGRYTLTELKFAERKWPSPVGRVLPVVVKPTDKAAIPAYLRAVVVLRPEGNAAAEVVAAVGRLSKPRWVRLLRRYAVVFIGVLVLGGGAAGWAFYDHWRTCDDASRLAREAKLQQGAADFAVAWDRYAEAITLCPGNDDATLGREQLASAWLDDIHVTEGKDSFSDIVNKVQPALSRGAVATDDRRAANALAHLGWADFLRTRDGTGGLDPVRYYKQAIAKDPKNPFAHAMWGHHLMWFGGSIDDANAHFSVAVASGLERAYVRKMQLSAFQLSSSSPDQDELVRVLNEMRVQGEGLAEGTPYDSPRWRIWNAYYSRLYYGNDRASFLAAVRPEEHLATFHWLFPDDLVPESKRSVHRFMLAQLQENAVDRRNALATYEALLKSLAAEGSEGPIVVMSREAVKRLRAN